MATINIYPSQDNRFKHSASSGSEGYSCINEEVADDATSYVYLSGSNSGSNVTSTFKMMPLVTIDRKIYLNSISWSSRSANSRDVESSSTRVSVSINGGTAVNGSSTNVSSTSFTTATGSFTSPSGLNTKYDSFSDANIVLSLYSTTTSSSKYSNNQLRTTQVFFTVDYSPYYNFSIAGTSNCTASVSESEVKEGDSVTFTATPTSGYQFQGWYSDESFTTLVSSESEYSFTSSEDISLYAKASRICTITLHGNSRFTTSQSASTGIEGDVISIGGTLSSSSYTFKGWYSDSTLATLYNLNKDINITIQDSDVELWARTGADHGLYIKENGIWKFVEKAYRKESGSWVEYSDPSQIFNSSYKYIRKEL